MRAAVRSRAFPRRVRLQASSYRPSTIPALTGASCITGASLQEIPPLIPRPIHWPARSYISANSC